MPFSLLFHLFSVNFSWTAEFDFHGLDLVVMYGPIPNEWAKSGPMDLYKDYVLLFDNFTSKVK